MAPHFTYGKLEGAVVLVKDRPLAVLRGELVNATTHFMPVFVKLLPPELRAVEIVCAWLGAELALPMPVPALVLVRRRIVQRLCAWPFGDAVESTCFGTLAIANALPLRVLGNASDVEVERTLGGWGDALRVGIFDELIANDDRNNGNLLIDAERKLWAIDHSRSLRAGGMTPFSDPLLPFANPLLQRLAKLPLAQRLALHGAVVRECARVATAAARVPYRELRIDDGIRDAIEQFIDMRARHLLTLVLSRLGIDELPSMQGLQPHVH